MKKYNPKSKRPKKASKPQSRKLGAEKVLRCPYCGSSVIYRSADGIYKENHVGAMLYVCSRYPECDAYITADPETKLPTGVMANGHTRALRIKAHHAFNKLFENQIMTRNEAYQWLGLILGIPCKDAHIRLMGDYHCKKVIEESERIISEWKKRHPWRELRKEEEDETDSRTETKS